MNLRAIILDFNGVVADDEAIHFRSFRAAFEDLGLVLERTTYFDRYMPMDDAGVVITFLGDQGRPADPRTIRALCLRKEAIYQDFVKDGVPLVAGATRFVREAARRWPLAIASGAIRREIEATLEAHGLARHIRGIVSAEDVGRRKPDPEAYLRALDILNRSVEPALAPEECLVLEDAPAGIAAARTAGMRAVGVATSFPPERLAAADLVVRSLEELDPETLAGMVG